MRLLGGEVGLRVARAHRQTPETQAAQQLADAALMQLDIELARDLLAQIDHSPTDNTVDPLVRTGAHPLRHRRHARGRTGRPGLRRCSDAPSRATFADPSRTDAPLPRGSGLPSPVPTPACGAQRVRQTSLPPAAATPPASAPFA